MTSVALPGGDGAGAGRAHLACSAGTVSRLRVRSAVVSRPGLRPTTRRLRRAVRRLTLVDRIALRARRASLGPVAPLSRWGFERDTSVDRWYIEPFLDAHRAASTGGCSRCWKAAPGVWTGSSRWRFPTASTSTSPWPPTMR
jgi:hypothetical protein